MILQGSLGSQEQVIRALHGGGGGGNPPPLMSPAARECSSIVIGRVVGNWMDERRDDNGDRGGVCQGLWLHRLRFSFLLTVVFYFFKKII